MNSLSIAPRHNSTKFVPQLAMLAVVNRFSSAVSAGRVAIVPPEVSKFSDPCCSKFSNCALFLIKFHPTHNAQPSAPLSLDILA